MRPRFDIAGHFVILGAVGAGVGIWKLVERLFGA